MRSSPLIAHVSAVAVVGMATVLTFGVYGWIQPSISLLFFPAVVIAAILGGYVSAVLATVLSTVSLAYFFVPPSRSFNIGLDDVIRLGAFAVVSLATAWLAEVVDQWLRLDVASRAAWGHALEFGSRQQRQGEAAVAESLKFLAVIRQHVLNLAERWSTGESTKFTGHVDS